MICECDGKSSERVFRPTSKKDKAENSTLSFDLCTLLLRRFQVFRGGGLRFSRVFLGNIGHAGSVRGRTGEQVALVGSCAKLLELFHAWQLLNVFQPEAQEEVLRRLIK